LGHTDISFLGKLFGSDKTIGKITDGIYNGVDKLVYTDEEKTENFHKVLKLYEPFKLAQRFLALTFGIPYALAWLTTFIASFWITDLSAQMELLSGDMGNVVLAIVGFYFLGGTAASIINKR